MINTKEKKKYKCRYVVGTYIQLKSNLQHTFFNQLEEKKNVKVILIPIPFYTSYNIFTLNIEI